MRVLISNDDGVDAPGLQALTSKLSRSEDEVWVVAPATEQSAQSHSLTMHRPLRVIRHGERRFAVTGTPADCIYLALHHVMPERPDIVVSGINAGSNLGTDVHYSGTVAAAREACLQGLPAIAVSLESAHDPERAAQWGTATAIAERVIRSVVASPLPPRVFLNVNVPNLPLPEVKGLKAARLSDRFYQPFVEERHDPRGRAYLWIGGRHSHFSDDPDSDGPAIEEGWATVTPMMATSTVEELITSLKGWTDA
ncbi:MAG: 5'/3'-nucleotidase SurE [Alphaproteobacteria bacterium]|nr:5'/3'-nucleotidase SurE [Alphaproteobacteria bacterium]MCB9698293.1 5'/3'-nucleotidase SurE [Alphaproteobacteria bacterium]